MPDTNTFIAALTELAHAAMSAGHLNTAAKMQALANELHSEQMIAAQPGLFATFERELHVAGGLH